MLPLRDLSYFHELVSGRRKGLSAGMLRGMLSLAEGPYGFVVRRRNAGFDQGRSPIERVDVPVVSVGNLTVGGTGKTPLVEWLARWFVARSMRVGIVSRGYGSRPGHPNDEALELAHKLPSVPHVQNPDRVAAARSIIADSACQAIVLDDGFQHRRLARDLDLVLLDALVPFGYGRLLPRGLLREPVSSLARADVVCLSRADLLSTAEREVLRNQVYALAPEAAWVELAHRPRILLAATGEEREVATLTQQPIAAFCGIGNPAGFRATLEQCGYSIAAWREFPDHHAYGQNDLDSLAAWANRGGADAVLCTHKDLVKLNASHLGERPLWALCVGVEVLAGRAELEARLQSLCAPATRHPP